MFCPCFYEQYIKSRTGVSFDMELLWQQPSQFEPWPFAFSSILRSLQIGCLWLVVWQFWLFLLSSSAIITFLVDLIAAFLFALSSDVLLFCYFLLLKIFFKIPFLSFFIWLVTIVGHSFQYPDKRTQWMKKKKLNDEMSRRVTVPFDLVRTYSILQILNGAIETWLSSFRFMTSDFASSDASISVTCLSKAFVFVCVVMATSSEFSSQRLMVVIYIRREWLT